MKKNEQIGWIVLNIFISPYCQAQLQLAISIEIELSLAFFLALVKGCIAGSGVRLYSWLKYRLVAN